MRAALRSAPARVRIDGVALSDCLGEDSGGTDIQRVGAGYLEAAAALGAPARRAPEGRAAVQLGYLIGAVRRGTAGSQGVYSELVWRLEQEAAPLRGRSRAFRRGERAGRRSG